jgi:hypothetical protein
MAEEPRSERRESPRHWRLRREVCLSLSLAWLSLCPALAESVAEGGSPLYSVAVRESVQGLKTGGKQEPVAAAQVCPKCGKVHATVAANETNQLAAAHPADSVPVGQPCPYCGQIHPPAAAAGSTNLPAPTGAGAASTFLGQPGRTYVYCPHCKVYHRSKSPLPTVASSLQPGLAPLEADHRTNNAVTAGGH